LISTFW